MNAVVFIAVAVLGQPGASQTNRDGESAQAGRIPKTLLAAVAGRVKFRTAQVRYRIDRDWWGGNLRMEWNREDRYADEDQISINFGDRDGFRSIDMDGRRTVDVALANTPLRELYSRRRGEHWIYHEGHTVVGARARLPTGLFDARVFGVFPNLLPDETPSQMSDRIGRMAGRYAWEEKAMADGLVRVRADSHRNMPHGRETRFEWTIDPDKDHSVLSAAIVIMHRDGRQEIHAKTESTYEKNADGVWFVKTLDWFNREIGTTKIEVQSASFNKSHHPRRLTPEMLDIPVGTLLWSRVGQEGPLDRPDHWNGHAIVTAEEWKATKHQYDTSEHDFLKTQPTPGKYPKWWHDGSGAYGLRGVERTPGLWEDYVRRWCHKHTFEIAKPIDENQKSAAFAVLKDCQKKADPIFRRIEKELKALDREIEGKSGESKKLAAAKERRSKLIAPIERIFEKQLKPRLEALLRTPQVIDEKPKGDVGPPKPPTKATLKTRFGGV